MEIKTFNISYDILGNAQYYYYGEVYAQSNLTYNIKFSFPLIDENEEVYVNIKRADRTTNSDSIRLGENLTLDLTGWFTAIPGTLEISPFIYHTITGQKKYCQIVTLNIIRTVNNDDGVEITLDTPISDFISLDMTRIGDNANIINVVYDSEKKPNGLENAYVGSVFRGSNAADLIEVKFEHDISLTSTVCFLAKRPDGLTTSKYLKMIRKDNRTFQFYLLDWFTFFPGNLECNVAVFGPILDDYQKVDTYGIFNIQIKDTVKSSTEEITTDLDIIDQIINRLSTVENKLLYSRSLVDVNSKYIEIYDNLNTIDYLKVGTYVGDNRSSNMENCPTDTEFKMEVFSIFLNEIRDAATQTWVYRVRMITDIFGNRWMQRANSGNTAGIFSFSKWFKIATSDDLDLKANNNDVVHLTGDEEISGIKVFDSISTDSLNLVDGEVILEGIYTQVFQSKHGTIATLEDLAAVSSLDIQVVTELPTTNISSKTIYLKPSTDNEGQNIYEEYIYVNNNWELIGTTQVDLANYYTKEEVDSIISNINGDKKITISCSHPVEITGYGQGDCNIAIDDQQMIITKIKGNSQPASPNLFNQETLVNLGFTKESDGRFLTTNPANQSGDVFWSNKKDYQGRLRIVYKVKTNSGSAGLAVKVRYTDGTTANMFPSSGLNSYYSYTALTSASKVVKEFYFSRSTSTATAYKDFAIYEDTSIDYYLPFNNHFVNSNNALISTGLNLINWKSLEKGVYLDYSTGNTITLSTHAETDFIRVIGGSNYYFMNSNGVSTHICYYNNDKNYISGVLALGSFTVPSNAKYMRITVALADVYSARLFYGVSDLGWQPYIEDRIKVHTELGIYDYIDNIANTLYRSTFIVDLATLVFESIGENIYQATLSTPHQANVGLCNEFKVIPTIAFSSAADNTIQIRDDNTISIKSLSGFPNLTGVQIIFARINPEVLPIILPDSMAVYKGGMQVQDGLVPYNLVKSYSITLVDQAMANVETDRSQQLLLNNANSSIENNYLEMINKTNNLKNGIVGLRDALSLTVEGTFLILKCDDVVLSKVNIRDATADPTNVVVTASLTGTQYFDKNLGLVGDYEEKVYIKNNTGYPINVTSVIGTKFLNPNRLITSVSNGSQINASANLFKTSENISSDDYIIDIEYTCNGGTYGVHTTITPSINS